MREFSDFVTFEILDSIVDLLKLDLDNDVNHVVAEIEGTYYHLGNVEVNEESAYKALEYHYVSYQET